MEHRGNRKPAASTQGGVCGQAMFGVGDGRDLRGVWVEFGAEW